MLVLSRKPGERVAIGSEINITVVEVKGNRAVIAIEAPQSLTIVRGELMLPPANSSDLPSAPAKR
jgi:carbon storage regulator